MDKLDLERLKVEKEEYDKEIRSLDYNIVEASVELYNAKSRNTQQEEEDENSKTNQLKVKIYNYEEEKANLTKVIWKKILNIKTELRQIIDKKIIENPNNKNKYLLNIFTINKITDIYFNIDELIALSYLLTNPESVETNNVEKVKKSVKTIKLKNNFKTKLVNKKKIDKLETKKEENTNNEEILKGEILDKEEKSYLIKQDNSLIAIDNLKDLLVIEKNPLEETRKVEAKSFDIEKQRVIDFVNLLNHICKVSKEYRIDIKTALDRFVNNYKVVKNTQYLQNDFDNISNNYLEIFKEILIKFKKDESIENLKDRIDNEKQEIKDIEKRILNNNIEMKELQRLIIELEKVYFVKNYAKKVQGQVAKEQGSQDIYKEKQRINTVFIPSENNSYKIDEKNVFEKIKKISYDKRMEHIVDVSKWTENVEEEIKYLNFSETDFQFIIYIIRQTENICNSNFEQIANLIINYCDFNLQLEDIEKIAKTKNKKLEDEEVITQILRIGIDNIKKRYSKIPFIGKKVLAILSAKMLNK